MNRRAAAAARGLAATVTLLALVIGLPLVLYRFGGNPVPHRILPAHQLAATLMRRDTGALFLAIVRDVSWLAWALFTLAVITETVAAVSGRRAPRLRIGFLQGIAAQLVAVAAMTFSGPVSTVLAATTSAPAVLTVNRAVPLAPVLGQAQVHLMAHATPIARAPAAAEAATASAQASDHPAAGGQVMSMASFQAVVVHPGDCLWAIAQRYLGDGELFPQIAALNVGHEMGGGQVFRDPTLIRPGWVLQLPAPGTPGLPAAGHPGPSHPSPGASTHPSHPSRHHHFNRPHPVATPTPAPDPSTPTPAPRASGGRHAAPGQPDSNATPPAAFTPAPGQGLHGGSNGGGGGTAVSVTPAAQREIPPLALFGAGMLAGGLVASLSRMRHRQRQSRRPGRRIPMPASAPVVQAEQRLRTSPPLQPATALRAALA
ncbi:MAG: LysM peptidoglycan-binding domain-containing protein, partial [Actinomycetota bacterium]